MSQTKTVVAINGDGIGREIVAAARRIVDAAVTKDNITIEWVEKKAGGEASMPMASHCRRRRLKLVKRRMLFC